MWDITVKNLNKTYKILIKKNTKKIHVTLAYEAAYKFIFSNAPQNACDYNVLQIFKLCKKYLGFPEKRFTQG